MKVNMEGKWLGFSILYICFHAEKDYRFRNQVKAHTCFKIPILEDVTHKK